MANGPDASSFTTIVSLLEEFEEQGYTANFGAREGAMVICFACRHETPAAEVHLDALRRLEGASDPADMAAVAAVRCPACGEKGTLVLRFGPEASQEDAEVLRALEDHRSH